MGGDVQMGFGANQFFDNLKKEVINPDGDGSIYFLLDQEVKKIVYPIIKNKISFEYVDDVYQEVFFSVWRNIASYLINMEDKTESQRIAWLITITKRRIADFYDKLSRLDPEKVYLEDIEYEIAVKDNSIDDNNEFTSRMREILFHLFSISTSPEKIISFVYSKIILSSETSSGKPSITSEYLKGYKLYDIFEMMKRDLEMCLEVKIPENVYLPLVEKLDKVQDDEKVGNKRFQLSVRTIVDGTNRIQKKMESKKSR